MLRMKDVAFIFSDGIRPLIDRRQPIHSITNNKGSNRINGEILVPLSELYSGLSLVLACVKKTGRLVSIDQSEKEGQENQADHHGPH